MAQLTPGAIGGGAASGSNGEWQLGVQLTPDHVPTPRDAPVINVSIGDRRPVSALELVA